MNSFLFFIQSVFSDFLHLFFPELCVACHRKLLFHENCLCTICLRQMPATNHLTHSPNSAERLFRGRITPVAAAAAYYYKREGKVKEMLHSIKYEGQKEAARQIGLYWGKILKDDSRYVNCQVIVPVPLHRLKLRKRGYNQSIYIARGLSEALQIPVYSDHIKRLNYYGSQTKRSRYDRWKNVKDSFTTSKPKALAGKHILLVDDVLTTGATIEACVIELKKIPGTQVSIFTLAIAQ